jgi:A/G-specific adenine glycosylase
VFLAEVLLTQTPAENVADVYPSLRETYPDLNALGAATRDELEATLEPLGF